MASPPKPWERPGAAAAAGASSAAIPSTTTAAPTATSTTSGAPPLPDLPNSLSTTNNSYNRGMNSMNSMNGMGGYGSSYGSSYGSGYGGYGSSMYGGMGGMGGYGRSMYGGMGGYGMGGYGGMGGMYGGMGGYGMGGMGGMNDPNSLTNRFSNGTAATFQMLEGLVTAFGGFAQMLESTYMATHSSFFAMVSVAEQFGNLRDTLGSILGIFTLMRWIRTLIAKITGRPPPADATALTPAAFAKFEGRAAIGPDGNPVPGGPTKASRKPLLFFLAAAFGIPYLMSKMIRAMASAQEEEQKRMEQQALEASQPVDPSKLEFCRLLYDFVPQQNTGVELEVRKGDLVAVLSKNDPAGNPSEWWQCRARDGRQGYLPSTYLEILKRSGQEVKAIKGAASVGSDSRTSSMTSAVEGKIEEGKKMAGEMQRSVFYS